MIKYNSHQSKVVFCIVDDIDTYSNNEIKNTIKNIADFTVSNLYTKGYDVFVGKDVDELLNNCNDYDYAVVMSPGTEYINGYAFFDALDNLLKEKFFVAGHVLDRTKYDAYYELHHQCYVVNMVLYNAFKRPTVGSFEKHVSNTQIEPNRSKTNYHDDYTPKWVEVGTRKVRYGNRCNGWNLLKTAFENNLPVIVFDENIRDNKCHYYPESEQDFYKQKSKIEHKLDYCKNEFIHKNNTEWSTGIDNKYQQLVLPASGTLYLDLIDSGTVIFYDYNKNALDYWRDKCPKKENVDYFFIKTNLLEKNNLCRYIDPDKKTLVNLSNIFCYEGTAAYYSLQHRLEKQHNIVNKIKNKVKDVDINFTLKANSGFIVDGNMQLPTWHLGEFLSAL